MVVNETIAKEVRVDIPEELYQDYIRVYQDEAQGRSMDEWVLSTMNRYVVQQLINVRQRDLEKYAGELSERFKVK